MQPVTSATKEHALPVSSPLEEHLHIAQLSLHGTPLIDRLPTEILVQIFLRTQEHDRARRSSSKLWLPVTQVSRHWHAVAVHHPILWCDIVIPSNHDFIKLCIARAKDAPLRVQFDDHRRTGLGKDSLALVLQRLERVGELHLIILSQTHREIQDQLKSLAPSLRSYSVVSFPPPR